MVNARTEFINHVASVDHQVKAALIINKNSDHVMFLKPGYNDQDFDLFLNSLDFKYNNDYGTQILFGNIWYHDSSWSDRDGYDGSEWWVHRVCPKIPDGTVGLFSLKEYCDNILN